MDRVLLGLLDQHVPPGIVTSFDTNKIGGLPDWIAKDPGPPQCRMCGLPSVFIGQMYCPLSKSLYHRTLYIFTCRQPQCSMQNHGWIVLRCQSKLSENVGSSVDPCSWQDSIADEWGAGANDWSNDESNDSSECSAGVNQFHSTASSNVDALTEQSLSDDGLPKDCAVAAAASKLTSLSIECNTSKSDFSVADCSQLTDAVIAGVEPVTDRSRTEFSAQLGAYYLYVIDEPDADDGLAYENSLLKKYIQQESTNLAELSAVGSSGECYVPSTVIFGKNVGDRTFYKFTKRVGRCPQQLIRYNYKGQPLFAKAAGTNLSIPACECGSPRVFELQLMPGLVKLLQTSSSSDPIVEFLSVYVFTCERSCWNDDNEDVCREEYVVVDLDDDLEQVDVVSRLLGSCDATRFAADSMVSVVSELDN